MFQNTGSNTLSETMNYLARAKLVKTISLKSIK